MGSYLRITLAYKTAQIIRVDTHNEARASYSLDHLYSVGVGYAEDLNAGGLDIFICFFCPFIGTL
jgi:hypothetical protein